MTLEDAFLIASEAHFGQRDNGGYPYFDHCLNVMLRLKTSEEKIVGVLHDTIEDTDITEKDLLQKNLPPQTVQLIASLSRKNDETYFDYIRRLLPSTTLRRLKLADAYENARMSRIPFPTERDYSLLKRTKKAIAMLEGSPSESHLYDDLKQQKRNFVDSDKTSYKIQTIATPIQLNLSVGEPLRIEGYATPIYDSKERIPYFIINDLCFIDHNTPLVLCESKNSPYGKIIAFPVNNLLDPNPRQQDFTFL